MTQTQKTRPTPTGTAWIVWGAVVIVWALISLIQIPVTVGTGSGAAGGAIVGGLVLVAVGVTLLVKGLNKRKAFRAR